MRHYEILRDGSTGDSVFVVRINPLAYKPYGVCMRQPQVNHTLAIGINYFHEGQGIGLYKAPNVCPNMISAKNEIRPVLFYHRKLNAWNITMPGDLSKSYVEDDLLFKFQAGPKLVWDGELAFTEGMKEGQFNADVARKTAHVAVGVDQVNKLVVGLFKGSDVAGVARVMHYHKCVRAFKCDGGSATTFSFVYDADHNDKGPNPRPQKHGNVVRYGLEFCR